MVKIQNKKKLFWTLIYLISIGSVFASLFFVQNKLNTINRKYNIAQKKLDSIRNEFIQYTEEIKGVKFRINDATKIKESKDSVNSTTQKLPLYPTHAFDNLANKKDSSSNINNLNFEEAKPVEVPTNKPEDVISNTEVIKKNTPLNNNFVIFSSDSSYSFFLLAAIDNPLIMKKTASTTSYEERIVEHFKSNFYIGILDKKSLIKYSSISSLEIVGINYSNREIILNANNLNLYESKAVVSTSNIPNTPLKGDRYLIFPVKVFEDDNLEARRIMGVNLKKYFLDRKLVVKLIELNNRR